MLLCLLLQRGVLEILHSDILLLKVDVTEASVEEYGAGVQLVLEPQLIVVDPSVTSQVYQSVVEVGQRLFEITDEEVGYSLLEIGDG